MEQSIVMIGVGEMGSVFARGLLRTGHPVFPVTRRMDLEQEAAKLSEPLLVLVAVAEKDIHSVLDTIPSQWRDRLVLLQNELLPRDWLQHKLFDPTVISVWFEKKKGQDSKVIIPSPIFGQHADTIKAALGSIDIPAKVLNTADELEYELVLKNVYILTSNIAGLVVNGTVGKLWDKHQELARAVANDVMDIQAWLTGKKPDREKLIQGMVEAFNGDLDHKCMGRSAPARLERAIKLADEAGLEVSKLREIQTSL